MKEERFRQLLTAFGALTHCSLKFTKDGKFRKFGFIGFKSEEEAQTLLNHFNNDTSRITFHHVPLYLEWAPVGVFSSTAPQGKEPQEASAEKDMVEPETSKNSVTVTPGVVWDIRDQRFSVMRKQELKSILRSKGPGAEGPARTF
ncbi:putative RNA-binding protein 19 [Ictidomys tridecemlineatus]